MRPKDSLHSPRLTDRSIGVTWGGSWRVWGFALVAGLCLAGCATEVAHFTPLGSPRPPKPANHPIDVFTNGVPSRPFDRVAILDVHCESQGFMVPTLQTDAVPMLIRQARAAGCDGVIEIQPREPAGWSLETRSLQVTAVGIAYR